MCDVHWKYDAIFAAIGFEREEEAKSKTGFIQFFSSAFYDFYSIKLFVFQIITLAIIKSYNKHKY